MAQSDDSSSNGKDIVIVGAGIIGCATAYYLSLDKTREEQIHLLEATPELFSSASGKAAGFLASDWFGPATESLGKLSFKLHEELASEHSGRQRWGFSYSTGTSLAQPINRSGARGEDWLRQGTSRAEAAAVHKFDGPNDGPAWLERKNGDSLEIISADNTVGQVDPLRLSQFLLAGAQERGVVLHQLVQPISIKKGKDGILAGIDIKHSDGKTETIACSRILIAAGAWSGRVFDRLFPTCTLNVSVSSLSGHSIVVKSDHWTEAHEQTGCHAVFTTDPSGISPEVFSRIGGEIYVAGLNDPHLTIPDRADQAEINETSVERLEEVARRMITKDKNERPELRVVRKGLCFRPITNTGNPIISRIPDKDIDLASASTHGVFMATGHGPWGISHSLGTGLVVSEMIDEKTLSANVDMLSI